MSAQTITTVGLLVGVHQAAEKLAHRIRALGTLHPDVPGLQAEERAAGVMHLAAAVDVALAGATKKSVRQDFTQGGMLWLPPERKAVAQRIVNDKATAFCPVVAVGGDAIAIDAERSFPQTDPNELGLAIAAWIEETIGDDTVLEWVTMPTIGDGKEFDAGDGIPVSLSYIPAAVELDEVDELVEMSDYEDPESLIETSEFALNDDATALEA